MKEFQICRLYFPCCKKYYYFFIFIKGGFDEYNYCIAKQDTCEYPNNEIEIAL